MDIHLRKIQLVQHILKIKDEQIIIGFESLLENLKTAKLKEKFFPLSIEEFNKRINDAEKDFIEGNFKDSNTLLSKYE